MPTVMRFGVGSAHSDGVGGRNAHNDSASRRGEVEGGGEPTMTAPRVGVGDGVHKWPTMILHRLEAGTGWRRPKGSAH